MISDTTASIAKTKKLMMANPLRCPRCNAPVVFAHGGTKSEVHILDGASPWKADYYAKCPVCKAEVGIKKINQ